jgi:uncharacterized membrane-anchored protein
LQENGVYKEGETHDLLKHQPFLVVKKLFSHVDAGGYYAEFIDALTDAEEYSVAELVQGEVRKRICVFQNLNKLSAIKS